jgi:hypothetical protein
LELGVLAGCRQVALFKDWRSLLGVTVAAIICRKTIHCIGLITYGIPKSTGVVLLDQDEHSLLTVKDD